MRKDLRNSVEDILVITYWSFQDALIQTYTLPYVKIIMKFLPGNSKIFLVTFEQKDRQLSPDEELLTRNELKEQGIHWVPLKYVPFSAHNVFRWAGILSRLYQISRNKNIYRIHTWCTQAGAIGYILSKLTGIPLILDSYEPHAESMVENKTWAKNSLAFKILFQFEKWQTSHAKTIISATEGMKDYAQKKYHATLQNFYVKPACVDLSLFNPSLRKKKDLVKKYGLEGKIVCVYAGKIGGIYLDKEIFAFFKVALNYWKSKFKVIFLTNHSKSEIEKFCKEAGLNPEVIISMFVPHKEVPEYLGLGDFAITPVKPIPTKRYCTPIKNGEYWALGLPVVIPNNISDDSYIIDKNRIGAVLNGFTETDFKQAVEKIDHILNGQSNHEVSNRIRKVAEEYRNFKIAYNIYHKIYGKNIDPSVA